MVMLHSLVFIGCSDIKFIKVFCEKAVKSLGRMQVYGTVNILQSVHDRQKVIAYLFSAVENTYCV